MSSVRVAVIGETDGVDVCSSVEENEAECFDKVSDEETGDD
jgi:hypothetical protein